MQTKPRMQRSLGNGTEKLSCQANPAPRPTCAGAARDRFRENEKPTRVIMALAQRGPDSRR